MKTAHWGLAAGLLALAGCDSTPRERQEIVRQETRQLDTAAQHAGHTLRRLGRQTARFDSANHARRAVPLDPKKQRVMDQQLLGGYADQVPGLTVATIAGAYGELLRATRVRRTGWDARDWDYAQATYRRLNDQLARVRLDLPARDELRIRAWQAEFTTLRAQRTAKDLQAATKK
ncbi:hypothetical protein [Hymenobacter psoromatis]|uniref:hypothetical protein n=1 Tax=Hymenobacter psoromatis TaxID=1484116 RepID=UPI001CBC3DFA|nr:hypothetical protein [Hymenobacter psoromatis]